MYVTKAVKSSSIGEPPGPAAQQDPRHQTGPGAQEHQAGRQDRAGLQEAGSPAQDNKQGEGRPNSCRVRI